MFVMHIPGNAFGVPRIHRVGYQIVKSFDKHHASTVLLLGDLSVVLKYRYSTVSVVTWS